MSSLTPGFSLAMDDKPPSKAYQRNPEFYWEPVTFLVEDQLFKVTRHMLEKSSKTFLTAVLPREDTAAVAGSDDEHPVVIPGVRRADFENLLKSIVHAEQKAIPQFSQDEWFSVLDLATRWRMADVRRMAILEITLLNSMKDVEQVVLGKEYAVVGWVRSGYWALTKRKTVVSTYSAKRLTLPTCLKVWQAQVSILNAAALRGYGPDNLEDQILNDIFASELDVVYQQSLAFGDEPRLFMPNFSKIGLPAFLVPPPLTLTRK
ncbi:uncharacterized protein EV420DRAFT_1538807 [Desarmillaria tabescens]|uniref:BTB domain-containing protein n=1 Tax=Armillaria tabescens TaxID=1929756 RepID=A0AA39KDJ9_ARMTA|nr:uncharacterized protein EV420DRAFT_1538807 [Desarmillaria tabescens]KAK0459194.1 hypothetical protein EV420DRAFT_1538807 [Desarmillaria tabescens]